MSNLWQRIAGAGRGIEAGWDDADVDRVWRGLGRKRRRRAVRAAIAGLALGAACGAVLFVMRESPASRPVTAGPGAPGARVPSAGPVATGGGVPGLSTSASHGAALGSASAPGPEASEARAPVRFPDGSEATPLGAGAFLAVVEESAERVMVDVVRGGGRFDVVHQPRRIFSVRAGDVTVTVLGTAFTVERVADRVGVAVTRGAVLVDWQVGTRRLRAGEEGWFPPLVVATPPRAGVGTGKAAARGRRRDLPRPAEAPAPPTLDGAAVSYETASSSPPARAADPGARPMRSMDATVEAGPEIPRPSSGARPGAPAEHPDALDPGGAAAEALLVAADEARLAGHPEQGAGLLRRLVREHARDPRAPLAAFSLGRLLLGELGRPAEAARAFARARALAPEGPLAEDALAREAEAWGRAGERERARARADEYLRLYPAGRRGPSAKALRDR